MEPAPSLQSGHGRAEPVIRPEQPAGLEARVGEALVANPSELSGANRPSHLRSLGGNTMQIIQCKASGRGQSGYLLGVALCHAYLVCELVLGICPAQC